MLEFYRAMLRFRHAHPALAKGSISLLDAPDNVLAFIREHEGERLLCVFNMSETAAEYIIPQGMAPTDAGCPGVTAAAIEGELDLEPFGAYIGVL